MLCVSVFFCLGDLYLARTQKTCRTQAAKPRFGWHLKIDIFLKLMPNCPYICYFAFIYIKLCTFTQTTDLWRQRKCPKELQRPKNDRSILCRLQKCLDPVKLVENDNTGCLNNLRIMHTYIKFDHFYEHLTHDTEKPRVCDAFLIFALRRPIVMFCTKAWNLADSAWSGI